jgi:hypothetical protein
MPNFFQKIWRFCEVNYVARSFSRFVHLVGCDSDPSLLAGLTVRGSLREKTLAQGCQSDLILGGFFPATFRIRLRKLQVHTGKTFAHEPLLFQRLIAAGTLS